MEIEISKINNILKANGYTIEQEEAIYNKQLQELYNNPRQYLDHLDYMVEYRVSWKNYRSNRPTLPYNLIEKHKVYKLDASIIEK